MDKKALPFAILIVGLFLASLIFSQLFQKSSYTLEENFDQLDNVVWQVSDKELGRTYLNPQNVSVYDGHLEIMLPAKTLEGGELAAVSTSGFGEYQIKMKLPEAPSSITGFFLYEPPDYYHEIDIEIFNQPDGKYLLTSYADGSVQNEFSGYLGFDPTTDFHQYGFYYTDHVLKFFVDQNEVATFDSGYSKEPMRLMINAWYPNWLAGISPETDKNLIIDWIHYREEEETE